MSTTTDINYKKIYTGKTGFTRSTIFSAEDHFLVAKASGYSEEYYRFFFTDIIALKVRIDKLANATLGVLSIFEVLAVLALLSGSFGLQWFGGIIFIILLLAIGYVIIYGPQAKLVFKTATTEKDFPMGPKNKILKLLKKLRPYIEKAQGEFAPDTLQEELLKDEKNYEV
jgi:hypothetical protein